MFDALPDIHVRLTGVSASGNSTAREYVLTGIYAPTGNKISLRGVSILEFRGDRIIRNSDYYDGGSFERQAAGG